MSISTHQSSAASFAPWHCDVLFDFEMAWAWQYSKRASHRAVEIGLHERAQVPRLLAAFQEFGTPANMGYCWSSVS